MNPIVERIEGASRHHGIDADFSMAAVESTARSLEIYVADERAGATWPGLLLVASVRAFVDDRMDRSSTTRTSRCWAQWFNVVARALGESLAEGSNEGQAAALEQVLQVVRSDAESSPASALHGDVVASIAASVAWHLVQKRLPLDAIGGSDRAFEELLVLYGHRFRFAPDAIEQHLSGRADVADDPILAAFALFACVVKGDIERAALIMGSERTDRSTLPLAAAKLIGYSITIAPQLQLGAESGSIAAQQLERLFESAIEVWEVHGAGPEFYRAEASLRASQIDTRGVLEAINQGIAFLSITGSTNAEEFLRLMEARASLLIRSQIAFELESVRGIRRDATEALDVARATSGQVPTIVGLFTAVIALVLGTSQIAQGVDPRGRLVLVIALGVVLLTFVVCLAAVMRLASRPRIAIGGLLAFIAGAVAVSGGLLALLYLVL